MEKALAEAAAAAAAADTSAGKYAAAPLDLIGAAAYSCIAQAGMM